MRTILLTVSVLTACADAPRPDAPLVRLAVVKSDPAHTPADARAEHINGALAWSPLGFDVELEDGTYPLTECQRRWYASDAPDARACQLTIGVILVDFLIERRGTSALANREERSIALDTRLTGYELEIATAHEIGHIVLDASNEEHTATGIMSGRTARTFTGGTMKREHLTSLMRVAGYHGDHATFTRLFIENRISKKAADQAFRSGEQARSAGVKCTCRSCVAAGRGPSSTRQSPMAQSFGTPSESGAEIKMHAELTDKVGAS